MASRASGQASLIGTELGRYHVAEKIGVGGMGEVYRAHDQHLDRDVAIKVLPSGSLSDNAARTLFRKEALILSRLNHPNVATIYDFDTKEGVDVLVMEYIAGHNLTEKIAGRPLPETEVVRLGIQLADGLAAAHERGILHRDLKPGNLRLAEDGRLKILDFGVAKLLHASENAATEAPTHKDAVAGTLPYMAPEQLRGEKADARADIYAAGCVLYQMATGQRPFPDAETSQLIGAILSREPLEASALNQSVSPELSHIVARCLQKDPQNRYPSAKELAVDLRRIARDIESAHHAPTQTVTPVHSGGLSRRAIVQLTSALLVVIVLSVAAFWAVRRYRPSAPADTPSIAVLPLVNLSPEKDQEYFSDGLAEELLNSLVKLQGLRVAARTSSFQFKGQDQDVQSIGKKLHVGVVLEGSVRKIGQRVRINMQLVQVSDGFHLWSDAYDRDVTDIFTVQEEIAQSVAAALKVTLLGGKAPSPRPTDIEAYNSYLKGKYFYARPSKDNLEKAISYFDQTVARDPNYAPAWAALSKARSIHAGASGAIEEFAAARKAAERALALDPKLAEAHAALGEIKLDYDWDWSGADAEFEQALALDSGGNGEVVARAASVAATLNRFDEALPLSRRAVELDPLGVSAHYLLAFTAWWSGHLDDAESAARRGLELDSQFPWLHSVLSRVYMARGKFPEALAEAQRESDPIFRLQALALVNHALGRKQEADGALGELVAKYGEAAAFQVAEVYAFRGEVDAAFTWLEKAYTQHDGGLTFVKGDPLLASLVQDPRYTAFLKKMRLVT